MLDAIPDHEPQRLSWEELLKRSQDNPAEFADFVEATQEWLLALCRRLVPRMWDAEDLMQEVFVRVLRGRLGYHGGPVEPWLNAIATNCSISLHRKKHAEKRDANSVSLGNSADKSIATEPFDPAATTARELVERREIVPLLLEVLTPAELEVVRLYFWEGRGLTEISTLLGKPLGTINSRFRRALERMARRHQELFPD